MLGGEYPPYSFKALEKTFIFAFDWQISRVADYLNAIEQALFFTLPIQKVLIGRIDYLIQHRLDISW
jgi:hypothetical protein